MALRLCFDFWTCTGTFWVLTTVSVYEDIHVVSLFSTRRTPAEGSAGVQLRRSHTLRNSSSSTTATETNSTSGRPVSLMDRMSRLTESQAEWQKKVEDKVNVFPSKKQQSPSWSRLFVRKSSWVFEWWIFVFNLTHTFFPNLSYFYLCCSKSTKMWISDPICYLLSATIAIYPAVMFVFLSETITNCIFLRLD